MAKKINEFESELDLIGNKNEKKKYFNVDADLRIWLTRAIKNSSLSRYQIAAAVSELLGKDISKYQVDTWTAKTKEGYHLPSAYLSALCSVLNDFGALQIIASPLPIQVIDESDATWLELIKLKHLEKKLELRKHELEARLQNEYDSQSPKK